MRVAWIFLALLFLSCMFIGLQDQNSAYEKMPTDFEPTQDEMIWAKKFIYLKFHTDYYQDFYLFSNDKTSPHNWTHALTEKVFVIILIWLYWDRCDRKDYKAVGAFLFIQAVDAIDALCLTHNNPWFHIHGLPITWNFVSVAIYSYICLHLKYIKNVT